jgi:hypothetical protein
VSEAPELITTLAASGSHQTLNSAAGVILPKKKDRLLFIFNNFEQKFIKRVLINCFIYLFNSKHIS